MIANYSHKWWYYAISVLLIIATLLLLIYSPIHRANALVASGVVIAAVLTALTAFGITTVVSGMTSAQVSDYIDGKLNEWATFKGSTIENLIQENLITKTATNIFAIGASAANGIREFIDWLKTDENITDNSNVELYSYQGSFKPLIIYNDTTILNNQLSSQNLLCSRPIGSHTYYLYLVYNGPPGSYAVCTVGNNNQFIIIPTEQVQSTIYTAQAYTYDQGSEAQITLSQSQYIYQYNHYYFCSGGQSTQFDDVTTWYVPMYANIQSALEAFDNGVDYGGSLFADAGTIDIPPTIANEDNLYLDVGAPSVADVSGLADWVLDEVEANNLSATYEVDTAPPIPTVGDVNIESISTGSISSIQSAVQSAIQSAIQQSEAIQVNTDHHILGFTLPSFDLNLSGIWHYVHDAVGTASPFINFLKSMLTSVPWLAIPLYMSFTLIVVLGVFRRFLH